MRLLVALGGNAIKQADQAGTTAEQFANCEKTAMQLARIVKEFGPDDWLAITHGNGPQSGNLSVQMEAVREKVPVQDLDVIGAMTQGQIGYMLQNTMQKHLRLLGVDQDVIAVVNQVEVDPDDPEFSGDTASKPVGNFLTEAEAKALKAEHPDYVVKQVKPGVEKGWRRCVPSPIPSANVEARAIREILAQGIIVIASGGGGIPVMRDEQGNHKGLEAVIDKDRAGEVMAQAIGADTFMMLTDVEHAMLNFGRANATPLGEVTTAEAKQRAAEGHFLAGSMGPKVAAAVKFVEEGGKRAIISSLDKAVEALEGKTGTIIVSQARVGATTAP
ncbi:MAG TPA: carbamate kinase [Thermoleophilia bacterium]|nr:carbamate kinase [Thermoleophilia bacterium]